MTVRNILTEVLRDGSDLYIQTEENLDVDLLLSLITKVSNDRNDRFLVETEWDRTDRLPNAGEMEINEKGYLLFWYVIHDGYFYIEKMDEEYEIIEFIKEMYGNSFIPDIVVLFDGKKKKYEVRKIGYDVIVTWKQKENGLLMAKHALRYATNMKKNKGEN